MATRPEPEAPSASERQVSMVRRRMDGRWPVGRGRVAVKGGAGAEVAAEGAAGAGPAEVGVAGAGLAAGGVAGPGLAGAELAGAELAAGGVAGPVLAGAELAAEGVAEPGVAASRPHPRQAAARSNQGKDPAAVALRRQCLLGITVEDVAAP